MYQIDNSTAAATQPASTPPGTPGFFTDGSLTGGVAATILPAEWLNATMMELANVIEAAGLVLSKSTFTQVRDAIKTIVQAGGSNYAVDTGTANAYAVAYAPAVSAIVDGLKLRFKASHANTTAATFSPNGLTAEPILGGAHAALQGGEIVANGDIEIVWNSSLEAWILLEQTGGSVQMAPAAQVNQSVPLSQVLGMRAVWTSSTTWTCPPGVTVGWLSGVPGGGGGGASGSNNTSNAASSGGGGGGAGQPAIRQPVTLVPGTVYSITIGAAGIGGPAPAQGSASTSANNGTNGGNTSFGTLLTLTGGTGGIAGTAGAASGAVPGGSGGAGFPNGGTASDGAPAPTLTTIPAWPGTSGSGGSSPFGGGGPSVRSASGSHVNGNAAGGFGAGGGGGGGPYSAGAAGGAGGNGSPGYLTIEW